MKHQFAANDSIIISMCGKVWMVTAALILFFLSLTGAVAFAQGGYPEPTDLYINDYAGLLASEDAANIRTLFTNLKRDHGIEATVVTINSIRNYNTGDETIEAFTTNLFNAWGIGDEARHDGVLILVAVQDRDMRIEVGSGYSHNQNTNMQEVINEHMLPSFKRDQYSQGIYRGARAVVGELTGTWPPDLSSTSPSSSSTNASDQSRLTQLSYNFFSNLLANISPGKLIGIAVVTLGAAGIGLRWYRRYHKRRCPHCQTHMTRLDEVADDVYLDSGQKLEETLKSVDYDVWKCPSCNFHSLYDYKNPFSSYYKKCLKCGYRTVSVRTTTVVQSTYSSTGQGRVTKDCRHCDFHQEETITLPKLTRSDDDDNGSWGSSRSSFGGSRSSSSGSSFGGGRSSGGGASGKW